VSSTTTSLPDIHKVRDQCLFRIAPTVNQAEHIAGLDRWIELCAVLNSRPGNLALRFGQQDCTGTAVHERAGGVVRGRTGLVRMADADLVPNLVAKDAFGIRVANERRIDHRQSWSLQRVAIAYVVIVERHPGDAHIKRCIVRIASDKPTDREGEKPLLLLAPDKVAILPQLPELRIVADDVAILVWYPDHDIARIVVLDQWIVDVGDLLIIILDDARSGSERDAALRDPDALRSALVAPPEHILEAFLADKVRVIDRRRTNQPALSEPNGKCVGACWQNRFGFQLWCAGLACRMVGRDEHGAGSQAGNKRKQRART
jgi:hypothetical protein